jgi:hypothetical protein
MDLFSCACFPRWYCDRERDAGRPDDALHVACLRSDVVERILAGDLGYRDGYNAAAVRVIEYGYSFQAFPLIDPTKIKRLVLGPFCDGLQHQFDVDGYPVSPMFTETPRDVAGFGAAFRALYFYSPGELVPYWLRIAEIVARLGIKAGLLLYDTSRFPAEEHPAELARLEAVTGAMVRTLEPRGFRVFRLPAGSPPHATNPLWSHYDEAWTVAVTASVLGALETGHEWACPEVK